MEGRHVIPRIAAAGFRVVAPDYCGTGHSSKPPAGYDKRAMAADIRRLLRDHLDVSGPFILVGHDIGMMVAYAYASSFPDEVERLVLMEAPLPGTDAYDRLVATRRLRQAQIWHFFLHNAPNDLAERLTAGRERIHIERFLDELAFDPLAIGRADRDRYADDNCQALKAKGKLRMPVLGLGGDGSFFAPIADAMLRELAADVSTATIPRCGHWIAEENPDALVEHLLGFIRPAA